MIKFQNKEGKKVMEMKDNGDVKIHDEKLQESFDKQEQAKNVKEITK